MAHLEGIHITKEPSSKRALHNVREGRPCFYAIMPNIKKKMHMFLELRGVSDQIRFKQINNAIGIPVGLKGKWERENTAK